MEVINYEYATIRSVKDLWYQIWRVFGTSLVVRRQELYNAPFSRLPILVKLEILLV